MKALLCIASLACALVLPFSVRGAADDAFPKEEALTPATPHAVLISPQNALLRVRHELDIHRDATGQAWCELVLPAGAGNLHFGADSPVWRTDTTSIRLANSGSMARLGRELERRIASVEGRLAAIRASLALWENKPTTITFQDLNQQIQNVQQTMPELVRERTLLERELQELRERLGNLQLPSTVGQKVVAWLDADATRQKAMLEYSYVLESCGWQPGYRFEARPGAKRGEDVVAVQLYADVWQFSGMDWDKARITLVTQSVGAREPARLPRWTVESAQPQPRARAVGDAMPLMAMEAATAKVEARKPAVNAGVRVDSSALYARYELSVPGLGEGRSQVRILADTWKTPLRWLARPVRGNTGVWLMADCELAPGKEWPAGKASFHLDGQNVGEGMFRPTGNKVTLFFGADPRVSLSIVNDSKKRGESGFIGKEKHWNWAWTYTLTNRHAQAVDVRIERPLPQLVDERVRLKLNDKPEATKDEAKHLLYWDVSLPANGQASITHELEISAPADMDISPVAP